MFETGGVLVGEAVLAGVDRARVALGEVAAAPADRCADGELSQVLEGVDGLALLVERVAMSAVTEAVARGLPGQEGYRVRDWLALRCPWAAPALLSDLTTLAQSVLDRPEHQVVADAVAAGTLPVRRAARVLRAMVRVAPFVRDPEVYAADLGAVLSVATRAEVTDADLRTVTDHLIALALPERDLEDRARACRQARGVHESSLADGSLTRFIIDADAEGAARIRAVLTSPLAAPAPDADGPDLRSPAQRRYDALLTVIGRGVGAPDGTPSTAKATILLTIAFAPLTAALTGAGITATGEALTPGQVRRLACDAQVIPMILGTESEVLDQGRAVRTATPGQLRRLWYRDKWCTYPGCSVPATWCDAHHLIWWSRGGPTDIDHLALLCPRHHTLVHDRDLAGILTATGIVWHTRPA